MKPDQKKGIEIQLTPEVATGQYANLAAINHGPNEFYIDFINYAPNMPQAKVVSRIIMTPENAKSLMHALNENVARYEATFGTIQPRVPLNAQGQSGENIPNPFINGGNA